MHQLRSAQGHGHPDARGGEKGPAPGAFRGSVALPALKIFFFLICNIFKVFIEFVAILLFYFTF